MNPECTWFTLHFLQLEVNYFLGLENRLSATWVSLPFIKKHVYQMQQYNEMILTLEYSLYFKLNGNLPPLKIP